MKDEQYDLNGFKIIFTYDQIIEQLKEKRKIMRKRTFLSILLLLVVFTAFLPISQAAALSASDSNVFDYQVKEDGTAEITGVSNVGDGAIVIPSTLDGLPVTNIGAHAFRECTDLASVTISQGITTIENSAFYDCTYLESVSLPNSLTTIGSSVFANCESLTSISIPQNVTSIGDSAFYDCSELISIFIPKEVKSIGKFAFVGCIKLKSILVDKNNSMYTSVDGILCDKTKKTLLACPGGVISVTIPHGITSIGAAAFKGSGLKTITIPPGVTDIGESAFNQCPDLTHINLPDTLKNIEPLAFNGCTGLTSLTIPPGLTKIDGGSFGNCTGLTRISIPPSVKLIINPFDNCSSLTRITFNSAATVIHGGLGIIPSTTKIIGYDPSTAKSYAESFHKKFEVISSTYVPTAVSQAVTPKIILDGTTLSFDVPPVIEDGRTMVPLRAIFEAMEARVYWEPNTMTATAVKGSTTVQLKIGSLEPTINGTVKQIDVAGRLVNDRIFVPLRFVCEAFGGTADWDADTQTATINLDSGLIQSKAPKLAEAYAMVIDEIYKVDPGLNRDIQYLAIDTSGMGNLTNQEKTKLLRILEDKHSLIVLKKTYEDLITEGYVKYIKDSVGNQQYEKYQEGILISIEDKPMEDNSITMYAIKYRSSSGAIGYTDLIIKYKDGGWVITSYGSRFAY